jgi:hypothetical protein
MCQNPENPAPRAGGVAASDHQQESGEPMITVLISVVFVVVVLALILLAIVVVAIRQEPRNVEMSYVAPSLIAVMVRRLLGVYLRRPTPSADSIRDRPTTACTEITTRPPGGRR